jgi:putative MATE family efflux protein
MGAAFVVVLVRSAGGDLRPQLRLMRRLVSVGRWIFIRTAALMAAFTLAGAIVTRFGDASIAAHQIAFQLWIFLAFVLDAIAIAGQVMIGRMLGAADAVAARAAAIRMIGWSVVIGGLFGLVLLAAGMAVPELFTDDPAVIARADDIWPLFALMMPFNGAVFALDGILIGAGDTRFLMWGMLAAAAVYIPIALLALRLDWGIVGVWWGLVALIAVRLVTCAVRFAGSRWALTGAPA